jgi:hypothetical protein
VRLPAFATLALAALAACAPAGPTRDPGPGLVPDADGLQPNGTSLRIDFGRAEDGVITAVSRLLGNDPDFRGSVTGCSLSAVRWEDGLTLWFDRGTFVGWTRTAPLGPGSAGRTCAGGVA